METKKKISLNDIIGAGSGIVLVLILVLSSIFGGMGAHAQAFPIPKSPPMHNPSSDMQRAATARTRSR